MRTTPATTAVLIALGEASRMKPLSINRPKALLPFCGRYLIEYALEELLEHGIAKVIIVTGVQPDGFHQIGSEFKRRGLPVDIVRRGLQFGSAGVVADLAAELTFNGEDLLVVYADSLFSADLTRLIQTHQARRSSGCLATLAYQTPEDLIVAGQSHSNYGVMRLDQDQRVTEFVEKPPIARIRSNCAFTGIFVLDPKVFEHFLSRRPLDFSKDVFQAIASGADSPVFAFNINHGYRYDIGTIDSFRAKQFAALAGDLKLDGLPVARICHTGQLDGGGLVEGRAMIGHGCDIEKSAVLRGYNVVGNHVSIGPNSLLYNCILFDGVKIGADVILNNCVLGETCQISDRAFLEDGSVLGDHNSV